MAQNDHDFERLKFPTGSKVKLTEEAIRYYGGRGAWVPPSQGGGTTGVVIVATKRRSDPKRPYLVAWGNGYDNSYREEDLRPAE